MVCCVILCMDKVYISYVYFTATILLYHSLRGIFKMTKSDMRKVLDLNLSVELWDDCFDGYMSILRFALCMKLITTAEHDWLARAI